MTQLLFAKASRGYNVKLVGVRLVGFNPVRAI